MKIFGIAVIKNEVDIIEYSLTEASHWATRIFVLDNGSTDGTWERVEALALRNDVIVPWKQLDQPFHNGLRALVFNEFRHEACEDDWWCMRLDADEFYIDDPRNFLARKIRQYYNVVCSRHVQYQLTDADMSAIDFTQPVTEIIRSLKYFSPFATSEIRFFRHRNRLHWSQTEELPRLLGMVSPERILLRHYQYRSPDQVIKRIATRMASRHSSSDAFLHMSSHRFEDYVARSVDCLHDEQDISVYKSLPLSNNQDLSYSWWKFWAYRILQATKVLT